MIRLAVTGTDTGVGKTTFATALLASLRQLGLRVAGMKPVETGVVRGASRSDAELLRTAAGAGDRLDDVCPLTFAAPLAPAVAAQRSGQRIDLGVLDAAFARLAEGRDAIVVEGAGGLLVPVTQTLYFDELFRRWHLDLLIVAANKLGAINHTLLTVRAARATGLAVRGVILNAPSAERDELVETTNADMLQTLLPDVPIFPFPHVPRPLDPGALAAAAASIDMRALLCSAAASAPQSFPSSRDRGHEIDL
jgi:dethiobiotin synthetase